MASVDDKVVSLTFDNDQFIKAVAEALKSIENLNDRLDSLEKSTESNTGVFSKLVDEVFGFKSSVTSSTTDVMNSLSNIENSISSLSDSFTGLGLIGNTVLQTLATSATNIVTNAISQAMSGGLTRALNIEQAQFLLEGLGMDIEEAMANANDAVTDTAYGLDVAAKACAQLGASGVQLGDDMTGALRGIAGVAAMTGSEYEDISNIFTTVAGNGKLMTQQLRQISARGLNASATIAEYLGTTEAKVNEMVTAGQIDFDTFAKAMDSAFGEHAKDANKTFTGALSNMKAALSRIGALFYTPGLQYARDIFNALTPAINNVKNAIVPFADVVETVMAGASGAFVDFMTSITDAGDDVSILTTYIQQPLQALADFTQYAFEQLPGVIERSNLVSLLTSVFTTLWDLLSLIADIGVDIFNPVFDVVNEIVTQFGRLVGVLSNHIYPIIMPIANGLHSIISLILEVASSILSAFGPVGELFGDIAEYGFNEFLDGIQYLAENFEKYANKFVDKAHEFFEETKILEKIRDNISNFIDKVREKIKEAYQFLDDSGILDNIKSVIRNFIDNIKNAINEFIDQGLIDIDFDLSDFVRGIIEFIKSKWETIVPTLESVLEFLKEKVQSFIEWVSEHLTIKDVAMVTVFVAFFNMMTGIMNLLQTLAKIAKAAEGSSKSTEQIFKTLKSIVHSLDFVFFVMLIGHIADIFSSLEGISESGMSVTQITKIMLVVAVFLAFVNQIANMKVSKTSNLAKMLSVVVICFALLKVIISITDSVNVSQLAAAALIFTAFLLVIAAIELVLTKTKASIKNASSLITTMAKFGLVILEIVVIMKLLSLINSSISVGAIVSAIAILAVFTTFIIAVEALITYLEGFGKSNKLKGLSSFTGTNNLFSTIIKFVSSFLLVMAEIKLMTAIASSIDIGSLAECGIILTGVTAAAISLEALGLVLKGVLKDGSIFTSIMGFCASMLATMALIKLISKINISITGLLKLAVVFTVLAAVIKILTTITNGKNLKGLQTSALNLLGFTTALLSIIVVANFLSWLDVGQIAKAVLIMTALWGFIIAANVFASMLTKSGAITYDNKVMTNIKWLVAMIAIIVGAMIWMSYLDIPSALSAAASIALVLAALSVVINSMSKLSGVNNVSMAAIGKVLMIIVAAAIIAAVLPYIENSLGVSWQECLAANAGLVLVIAALMLTVQALYGLSNIGEAISTVGIESFGKIAILLAMAAVVAAVLPWIMKALGISWSESLAACGSFVLVCAGIVACVGAASLLARPNVSTLSMGTIASILLLLVGVAIIAAAITWLSNTFELDLGKVEQWILIIGELEGLILVAATVATLMTSKFGAVTFNIAPFVTAGLIVAACAALALVIAEFMPESIDLGNFETMILGITELAGLVTAIGGALELLELAASAAISKLGLSAGSLVAGGAVVAGSVLGGTAIVTLVVALISLASYLSQTYNFSIDLSFFEDISEAFWDLGGIIAGIGAAVGILSALVSAGAGGVVLCGIALTAVFTALVAVVVAIGTFAAEIWDEYQRNKKQADNLAQIDIMDTFLTFVESWSDRLDEGQIARAERITDMADKWLSHLESSSFTNFISWLGNNAGVLSNIAGQSGAIQNLGLCFTNLSLLLDNELFQKSPDAISKSTEIISQVVGIFTEDFNTSIGYLNDMTDIGEDPSNALTNLGKALTSFAQVVMAKDLHGDYINWSSQGLEKAVGYLSTLAELITTVEWDNFKEVPDNFNSENMTNIGEALSAFVSSLSDGVFSNSGLFSSFVDTYTFKSILTSVTDFLNFFGSEEFQDILSLFSGDSGFSLGPIKWESTTSQIDSLVEGLNKISESIASIADLGSEINVAKVRAILNPIKEFITALDEIITDDTFESVSSGTSSGDISTKWSSWSDKVSEMAKGLEDMCRTIADIVNDDSINAEKLGDLDFWTNLTTVIGQILSAFTSININGDIKEGGLAQWFTGDMSTYLSNMTDSLGDFGTSLVDFRNSVMGQGIDWIEEKDSIIAAVTAMSEILTAMNGMESLFTDIGGANTMISDAMIMMSQLEIGKSEDEASKIASDAKSTVSLSEAFDILAQFFEGLGKGIVALNDVLISSENDIDISKIEAAATVFGDVIESANGLYETVDGVEGVFDVDKFIDVFGENSNWDEFFSTFGNVLSNLNDFNSSSFIGEDGVNVDNIIDAITGLETIIENVKELSENLDAFDFIEGNDSIFENISDWFGGSESDDWTTNIIAFIDGVKNVCEALSSDFDDVTFDPFTKINTFLLYMNTIGTKVKDFAGEDGLLSAFDDFSGNADWATNITNFIDGVKNVCEALSSDFDDVTFDPFTKINTFLLYMSTISTKVKDFAGEDGLLSAFDDFSGNADWATNITNFIDGVKNVCEALSSDFTFNKNNFVDLNQALLYLDTTAKLLKDMTGEGGSLSAFDVVEGDQSLIDNIVGFFTGGESDKWYENIITFVDDIKVVIQKMSEITDASSSVSNITNTITSISNIAELAKGMLDDNGSLSYFDNYSDGLGWITNITNFVNGIKQIIKKLNFNFDPSGFVNLNQILLYLESTAKLLKDMTGEGGSLSIFDDFGDKSLLDSALDAVLGEGSISNWITNFQNFIQGIKSIVESLDFDLDISSLSKFSDLNQVLLYLDTTAKTLETMTGEEGSLSAFDDFSGNADWATNITNFIDGINSIVDSLNIEIDSSALTIFTTINQVLLYLDSTAKLLKDMLGEEGSLSIFMNSGNASSFEFSTDWVDNLKEFIIHIKDVLSVLSEITEIPDSSIYVALQEFMAGMQTISGYFGTDNGGSIFDSFSNADTSNFEEVCLNIVAGFNAISSITSDQIDSMSNISTAITTLMTTLENITDVTLTEFATNFAEAMRNLVVEGITAFTDEITNSTGTLTDSVVTLLTAICTCITDSSPQFTTAVQTLVDSVVSYALDAIESAKSTIQSAVESALYSIAGSIGSSTMCAVFRSNASTLGDAIVQGIYNGINSSSYKSMITSAATSIASSAITAAKSALQINSPSKVFEEIGLSVGEGFVNGLEDLSNLHQVKDAGANIAKAAINSANNLLSNSDDISTFTISLVVDSSDARDDLNKVDDIFNHGPISLFDSTALAFKEYRDYKNSLSDISNQPSGEIVNNYEFVQNNNSPRALNRTEIYRQTKNQFTRFRNRVAV